MRIFNSTPRDDNFRMPGEFERHQGCIMIWPVRPGSWIYGGKAAKKVFAKIAAIIAQSEHVYMLADHEHLKEAQRMAAKVTEALTGAGIWGVEFFLSHDNGVYFSELSPRPHDTGMVTLAGTQNLNEFELHLRAVLGLPIPEITQERIGASAVILSPIASKEQPRYRGEEEVCKETNTYLRIFGKPYTKVNRRMGVVVCYAPNGSDLDALRDKCKAIAAKVEVY